MPLPCFPAAHCLVTSQYSTVQLCIKQHLTVQLSLFVCSPCAAPGDGREAAAAEPGRPHPLAAGPASRGLTEPTMCSRSLKTQRLERHVWMSPQGQHTWDTKPPLPGLHLRCRVPGDPRVRHLPVYGPEEVRRLLFAVWELEGVGDGPATGEGERGACCCHRWCRALGLEAEWGAANSHSLGSRPGYELHSTVPVLCSAVQCSAVL